MSLRVGDVKRWDVFTISEQLEELSGELYRTGKKLHDDDDMYEDIYYAVDVLHELAQELLEAAQRSGEVMMEV